MVQVAAPLVVVAAAAEEEGAGDGGVVRCLLLLLGRTIVTTPRPMVTASTVSEGDRGTISGEMQPVLLPPLRAGFDLLSRNETNASSVTALDCGTTAGRVNILRQHRWVEIRGVARMWVVVVGEEGVVLKTKMTTMTEILESCKLPPSRCRPRPAERL